MKIGFRRAVIAVGTAVVMLTSVFAGTVVAASTNEITVGASALSVKQGESFDVSVGFEAGDSGASGFQLYLHYDSSKVEAYVPTIDEQNGRYNVGSRFSVITNYDYSSSAVKIVGANLSANNITVDTPLSLVTFRPKAGASGKAAFWIEVEKLVENKDGSMVNTTYTVPTKSNPVYVSIQAPVTTTTTTTTTTAKAVTTTTKITTTTEKITTTPEVTTTTEEITTTPEVTTTTEKVTTTPEVTTTTEKVTTTPEVTTTTEEVTTTPEVTTTTEEVTTTPEVTTTTEKATTNPESTTTSEESVSNQPVAVIGGDEPLYTYSQTDGEYDEAAVEPYCVDLKEYVDDFSVSYNVKVSVSSDGYAKGSVSMNDVDGNWTKHCQNTDTEVWEAENITLDRNDALVFVQLFYVSPGTTFSVERIEVTAVKAEASEPDQEKPEEAEPSENEPVAADGDTTESEKVKDFVDSLPENDKNPQTSDETRSVLVFALIGIEVAAMGMTLFFSDRTKKEKAED